MSVFKADSVMQASRECIERGGDESEHVCVYYVCVRVCRLWV